jgi:hypothetical protein
MLELADVFRRAGDAYRSAFHGRVPPSHLRAMDDIVRCRTPALGGSLYACDDCGTEHYAYHSCRNRHCPKCQDDRAQTWLDRLRARLLPCPYFLLTFTLPSQLRGLARSHQRLVYAALLREAAASVLALAADPHWLGSRPAILAVLHTWSRTLAYHPHVHLLVSAGGLSPDASAWTKPAHPRFLFPGFVLSPIFRAKVHAALSKAQLAHLVCPVVWQTPWTVHVKRIGSGEHAALYLSRYVYRVALTNGRIERFEHGRITFRYTHARTRHTRRMTLPAFDFISRFLQHVLPRRFAKIRSYGLLAPGARPDLERARQILVAAAERDALTLPAKPGVPDDLAADTGSDASAASAPLRLCPHCGGGHLRLIDLIPSPRAPP